MTKLANSKVFRCGATAREWTYGTDEIGVKGTDDNVNFRFDLKSKGGGVTQILLNVGTEDFPTLLTAMLRADRGTTMRHMAEAIAGEMRRQPEHDKAVAKKAREAVLELAESAYEEAPDRRNHAEMIGRDMVQEWVQQLNKADGVESTK